MLLKFKDKVDVDLLEKESYKYLSAIEGVNDFIFSKNISPEGKSKGFTHAFVMGLVQNLTETQFIYLIRNTFLC